MAWDATNARSALGRVARAERALAARGGGVLPEFETLCGADAGPFAAAWRSLNDDLNTAEALGHLFVTLKSLKPETLNPEAAAAAHRGLHFVLAAFGIILPEPEDQEDVPDDVRAVAGKRWAARTAKNWPEADALRMELDALGWSMKDGKAGYELSRK